MMTFWIAASIMMLAGVVLILPAIFRQRIQSDISRKDLNISIYQQRIKELEKEQSNGIINADQYKQACLELDRTFLSDLSGVDKEGHIKHLSARGRWATLLSVVILIPVMATPLYFYFGTPELLSPQSAQNPAEMNMDSMSTAVNSLVMRLKTEPESIEGWKLLGRSYATLNRFDDAKLAYGKALKLNDRDEPLLLDYAELLTSLNEGDPRGHPESLIQRVLSFSPNSERALWLYGIVRYYYDDYSGTLKSWNKLLSMQQAGTEQEVFVKENIEKVKATLMASASQPSSMQDASAQNESKEGDRRDTGKPVSVSVSVSLDKRFIDQVKGSDIVFIYAKAVDGPPMPLAVVRKPVSELPIIVTLDDSMAMMPRARISNFKKIKIGAHISRSGMAKKQSGDLYGISKPLDIPDVRKTEVTINQAVP